MWSGPIKRQKSDLEESLPGAQVDRLNEEQESPPVTNRNCQTGVETSLKEEAVD